MGEAARERAIRVETVQRERWRWWALGAVLALCAGCALVVTARLATPYSYWLDELYSVTASLQDLRRLHAILMLDMHPPLYHLTLKAWMAVLGDAEPTTRALSAVFALGAVAVILYRASPRGPTFVLCCAAVACSSPLLAYYANETRPYAMLLFLSSLVVTGYVLRSGREVGAGLLVSCLLLALTHYFGLVLAGVVLLFCLAESWRDRWAQLRIVAAGVLCLLWPLYHAWRGRILTRTGGNFWIRVDGVGDTLSTALSGFLWREFHRGAIVLLVAAVVAAVVLGGLARSRPGAGEDLAPVALRSGLLLAAFLAVIALVDRFAPMSTPRNHIVLLPLLALLAASIVTLACGYVPRARVPALAAAALAAVFMLRVSYGKVREKAEPRQDWKSAARVAVEHARGRTLYFVTFREQDPEWRRLVSNHYLVKTSRSALVASAFIPGETGIERPALVLGGHHWKEAERLERELARLGARRLFPAAADRLAATVWAVE